MTPYDDGRPIDAAEAWSCFAIVLYGAAVLLLALGLYGDARGLVGASMWTGIAGLVAHGRGR